jgi:hypothetical protein
MDSLRHRPWAGKTNFFGTRNPATVRFEPIVTRDLGCGLFFPSVDSNFQTMAANCSLHCAPIH